MKLLLAFSVPGKPVTQGSLAHNRAGKLYQKPELVLWREKIRDVAHLYARQAGLDLPLDFPVHIKADFYLIRPKQPKFPVPAGQYDLDKLLRAIGDALSPKPKEQRILQDDSRITSWHATKHYAAVGEERVEIEIWGTKPKEARIKWPA